MNIEKIAQRKAIIFNLLSYNPSIPHLTAAKMLAKDYPDLFQDIEKARLSLRYYTGNQGRLNRSFGDITLHREPFTGNAIPQPTPFWDSTPVVFDTESCLIFSDVHIPFHVPAAIEIAVSYAKKNGVKDVLALGDISDHYQMSDFFRVPDVATLTQELADSKQFLQWLRKQFPKGRIIYKEGNHEERFACKVHRCLPEVGRLLDRFDYDQMGIKELGIELVQDRRRIDMGYLTAIHGHELGSGTSVLVNAARTLQLKAKDITICGHWHTPAQHRVRTLRGSHIGCWALGCLCNLSPHYRPVNDWEHGFSIYRRKDSKGGFVIENKTIIGGNVV